MGDQAGQPDQPNVYQRQIERLTARVLYETERQLATGPPETRREILKTIVPYLFRASDEKSVDEELVELREVVTQQNELIVELMYKTRPAMSLPAGPPPDTPDTPDTPDIPDIPESDTPATPDPTVKKRKPRAKPAAKPRATGKPDETR